MIASMEHSNWVLAKARCTEEAIIDELAKAIRRDLTQFNGLNVETRQDRLFILTDTNGGAPYSVHHAQTVYDYRRGQVLQVEPTQKDDHIKIYTPPAGLGACREKHWSMAIHPVWNGETLTCDLFIDSDESSSSIAQISQRILCDFLFSA